MEPYQQLEALFSGFAGTKHAVAVNTGTAALHLALAALGIGPGDEVIVPEFTMYACALAVLYTGATPVFVDCGPDLNLDPAQLEAKLSERTKAVMAVHVYGRMCDMKAIMAFAEREALYVIEDASEAHGAIQDGKVAGSIGHIGCFSFYRNKIVHAEEGGILVTNLSWLASQAQHMKNMAFGTPHNYLHGGLGFNYRMTNSQASLAMASLDQIVPNLKRRRAIAEAYDSYFPGLAVHRPNGSVIWQYDFRCGAANQERIVAAVPGARHGFKPMSMQPIFNREFENLAATRYSREIVYLPVSEEMDDEDVELAARAARKAMKT